MTREYLNVVLKDHDEGNHIFFSTIFQDLKIDIKFQAFFSEADLMQYLNRKSAPVPDVLFMNYDMPENDALDCLDEIKSNERYSTMTVAVYSEQISSAEEEEIFVRGANVFMRKPALYQDLRKRVNEIMAVSWQYHTCGLNKDNFIMKV